MLITKTSPMTGKPFTMDLDITEEQFQRYITGSGLIQDVLPHLTPVEREFLITGLTPEEQERVFGSLSDG